jgi:hypothetical protein
VILASLAQDQNTEESAQDDAQAVRKRGIAADVLDSSAYSSLRSGYWVVYSERFTSRSAATEATLRLRSAGYGDAYPRCVGTADQCTSSG